MHSSGVDRVGSGLDLAPVLTSDQLRFRLLRELNQHDRLHRRSFFVSLALNLAGRGWLDAAAIAAHTPQLAELIRVHTGAAFVGGDGAGRLVFLMSENAPQRRLQTLAEAIMAASNDHGWAQLTPALGYVALGRPRRLTELTNCALSALQQAQLNNDAQPVRYRPAAERGWGDGWRHGRFSLLFQVGVSAFLGFGAPFLIYTGFARAGFDITPAVYLATVGILLITSYLIWYEGFQAIQSKQPPATPEGYYPPASAIIAAYLPNEADTIVETVRVFLEQIRYPGPLEIVLSYNTPAELPVEAELRALVQRDPRLRLLRVAGSSSKAQNINAALDQIGGAFVGVFDADHHPAPDSFSRAWRWIASGYDIVQGHCVIRNGDANWLTQLVSVEFETIYAVAHPGRARVHGFGLFGGSNGYWRTEVLRATRMRNTMLTEDIDSSVRALLAGRRIASDPLLLSYELAPLSLGPLWNQRLRWAQGWLQVALRHSWAALRAPTLSARQKLGLFHLLVWREIYPWISIQIVNILMFWIWTDGFARINLMVPIFVLTTLLTFSSGPGQVLFAYLLGTPTIRRRWRWYLAYLVSAPLFYSGIKNLISRVATVKEAMRDQQWKVTPRSQTVALKSTGAKQ